MKHLYLILSRLALAIVVACTGLSLCAAQAEVERADATLERGIAGTPWVIQEYKGPTAQYRFPADRLAQEEELRRQEILGSWYRPGLSPTEAEKLIREKQEFDRESELSLREYFGEKHRPQ